MPADRTVPATHDTHLEPGDLDPERPRPVETPWGSFSIYRVDGRWEALQSFCPHLMGPLFQGTRSGDEISCPWHRWRFSLESGERVDEHSAQDPARDRLARCAVSVGPKGTLVLAAPDRAMAGGL